MSFRDFKDSLDGDPKKKVIAIVLLVGILLLVIAIFAGLAFRLNMMKGQNVRASDLMGGESVNTTRNNAGGIIADIDWDNVIGYDRDLNPIYGTNGLVNSVGGYDMCGAPILKEDMIVIDTAEDGLPIYDYSAIEQARMRGLTDGLNPDIDWNTVVAYDSDGNPIFGTFGADPDIFGYDMLGNPLYKSEIEITGYTDSGLPIIKYSTREVAKKIGKKQQDDIANGRDISGIGDPSKNKKKKGDDDSSSGKSKEPKTIKTVDKKDDNNNSGGNGSSSGGNGNGDSSHTTTIIKGDKGDKGDPGRSTGGSSTTQKGPRGPKGDKGDPGKSGTSISGSKGEPGKSGENGKSIQGEKGEKGERGSAGKQGISSYAHIMYAKNDPSKKPDGAEPLLTSPTQETKFIGIYYDSSKIASNKASMYAWSRLKDLSISTRIDNDGAVVLKIK